MSGRRGLTLIDLIVVFVLIAVMFCSLVYMNLDDPRRAKVSRAKSDMRSIATALESYYVDHGCYPAWSADLERNAFGTMARKYPELARQPTFAVAHGTRLETLTTPVSYLPDIFGDPLANLKGATFCYWVSKRDKPEPVDAGWILWSPGPDLKYDLTMDNIAQAYDPLKPLPTKLLSNLTYDPTNGATSAGDVWHVKH